MYEKNNPLDKLDTEILLKSDDITIEVTKQLQESDYDIFWNMVHDGFIDLNRKSYEKQDMTREELEKDLRSDNVLKYVARDEDSSPVGLLTVHIGFEDISWTDVDSLREVQELHDAEAVPYYVGTIVVPPDARGTNAASSLIRGAMIHFKTVNAAKEEDSLVFFDCAEENYPWLGNFIQDMSKPSDEQPDLNGEVVELFTDSWVQSADGTASKVRDRQNDDGATVLDRQHYYAIQVDIPLK